MSDDLKSSQPAVKIDVGVGAKAEARFEVKTEVPAAASGRLVDALVDIIRPFSERRGLKADLIRLQREEVAIDIMQRAQERLRIAGKTPSPIPNKILVPLLEKASLEEPDSDLIDKWANLLAATADRPNFASITFADILSEISSEQAKLLEAIASPYQRCVPQAITMRDFGVSRGPEWLEGVYKKGFTELHSKKKRIDLQSIRKQIDKYDLCYTVALRTRESSSDYWHGENDNYYMNNPTHFEILQRQGLIEQNRIEMEFPDHAFAVTVFSMTELGIEFMYTVRGRDWMDEFVENNAAESS